jgi:hypothetical protein
MTSGTAAETVLRMQARTKKILGIVGIVVVLLIATGAGTAYWMFWVKPFGPLHAEAASVVAGIPSTHVSTADGSGYADGESDNFIFYTSVTAEVFDVHLSPKRACAALSSNLQRVYMANPYSGDIEPPSSYGLGSATPIVQYGGGPVQVCSGALSTRSGEISYVAARGEDGPRVTVTVRSSNPSTLRKNSVT